jgi:hypothetical protein
MEIQVVNNQLDVKLSKLDMILCLKRSFVIPLKNVASIVPCAPKTEIWKELRAPGTFFPGIIKAGTYYTKRGKEFWLVRDGQQILNIEVNSMHYKRFVLGVKSNKDILWRMNA